MAEITLEDMAKRLTALERQMATLSDQTPAKDWRRTIGMFEGSEFMAQVEAEMMAAREAERAAARAGETE